MRWAPWILRFVVLVAGVLAFMFGGEGWIVLLAAFVLSFAGRWANLPPAWDLAWVTLLAMNATGNAFGFYRDIALYDRFTHAIGTALIAPVLYMALVRHEALPAPERAVGKARVLAVFTITFALGELVAVVWELFEWGMDSVASTNLSKGYTDTLLDLSMDTIGAAVGGVALLAWGRWRAPSGSAR